MQCINYIYYILFHSTNDDQYCITSSTAIAEIPVSSDLNTKMKRKADSLYFNPESKKTYVPISIKKLHKIIRFPLTNAVYGIFAKPIIDYDDKQPLDIQEKKYVDNLYNSLGKIQLDIYDLHFILTLYNNMELYVCKDLNMIMNNDLNRFIIKCEKGYYNVLIDHEKEIVKIIDSIDDYDYDSDLKRLSSYQSELGKISLYKMRVEKVNTNFKEATDILAVLMYMICKNNAFVDYIDVILMKDLIKQYINRLQYNNYGTLKVAFKFVATKRSEKSSVTYPEKIYNSLNFVKKIKDNFDYNNIRFYGKVQASVNDCNWFIHLLNKDHKLTTDEFSTLLHSINRDNHNVIDPLVLQIHHTIKNCIDKDGTYLFPICDSDLDHWTLWEVEYKRYDHFIYHIYDSLSMYKGDYNSSRNRIQNMINDIFDTCDCIYKEMFIYEDTVIKQGSDNSCGYFTLFYTGARIKKYDIHRIEHIESFDIEYFIEDLKNEINDLPNEEKAKLYYYSTKKLTYYNFI